MTDAYEFDLPEEIREWINHQKEQGFGHLAYLLDKGKITKTDWLAAAIWWETDFDSCRVDKTDVPGGYVSTVFIPFDMNYNNWAEPWEGKPKEPPLLFETMVFGGKWSDYQKRHSTLGEAKKGHWEVVEKIKAGESPPWQTLSE